MSESTETPSRSHLQAVPEDAPASEPTPPAQGRGGGHLTGLLALLLAVAVLGFLAQFSESRQLQAENAALRNALAGSEAELEAAQEQMGEARNALGSLRDLLARIEGILAPPAD